jgi:SAGA-associated factor 29
VRDPEVDASGKHATRRVLARHLLPIPRENSMTQFFKDGMSVYAKYPQTDTFYKATVKSFKKLERSSTYLLAFDDDDQPLQTVDARFVFEIKDNKDSKLKDNKSKN